MRALILAISMLLTGATAHASCTNLMTGLNLQIPNFNDSGNVWAQCLRNDLITLNSNAGGGGGGSAAFATDNFLGKVDGVNKVFTLSQPPISSSSVFVMLDGIVQSGTSDYVFTPLTITMTTAPAANSSSFFAVYAINVQSSSSTAILGSTQTFSGANIFTSSVTMTGIVKISSGSSIDFSPSLGYTTSQQIFSESVLGSSITFTVLGSTVACWHSGGATANAANSTLASILIDGGFYHGMSSTIGFSGGASGGSAGADLSFYREIQVSPGQHTFSLSIRVTGSQTITYPNSLISAQFGCREVNSR